MKMAETSIHHKKPTTKTGTQRHSEFYRHVILPSKTYKEKPKLPLTEVKNAAITYKKQLPLGKEDTEKYRNSFQRQVAIDMLRQGYHHSFREFCAILVWQKEDRERLGSEHPIHRQPLLDKEPDKLRFLCIHLNKAEEAARRCKYSNMYKSYLEIASFFSKSDDYWLSDVFYKKCLSIAQTYSQLDSELAAQAYLNIGLSYERQGDFMKALRSFEKYRQKGKDYYALRTDANLQLARFYMKLAEHRTHNESLQYMIKGHEASIQSDDKKVENEINYKLGLAYLERNDIDSALKYLHTYYDYCQQVADDEGFGQASETLAICYQKKGNIEKSTEYLTKYLQKVSTQEGENQYAKAYSALGLIETTLGHYDSAIASSSKAFGISLENTHSDLDRNRVLYGIAKGFKLRSILNNYIDDMNLDDLIQWKSTQLESYLIESKP